MPLIKSSASKRRAYIVAVILLLSKIIPSCSYYILKGLVWVAIIVLLNCQPFFYTKYTKLNIYLSCDIKSVSNAKCTFLIRLCILQSL